MNQHGVGSPPGGVRHAGTALLTALVFLLILTLLGTFGMNLSRLENRMAGNARFQALALGNAEFVLAAAEADIRSQKGNPFSPDRPGDQYYPQDTLDFDTATAGIQQPADRLWSFASAYLSLPDVDGDGSDSDGDGNADDGTGQYIIQDAGLELAFTQHPARRNAPAALVNSTVQAFLVTARSQTPGGALRTVQSVFVWTPLPATQSTGTGQAPRNAGTPAATAPGPNPAYGRRSWIDLRQ